MSASLSSSVYFSDWIRWWTTGFRFPEDEGNKAVRNVGILPQHHNAQQSRRPRLGFFNIVGEDLDSSSDIMIISVLP